MEDTQQPQVPQPAPTEQPLVPPESAPQQTPAVPFTLAEKPRVRILVITLLFILLLGVGGGVLYVAKFRQARQAGPKASLSPTKAETVSDLRSLGSGSCQFQDFPQPQVRYPREDSSVILLTGMVDRDFQLERSAPWYSLSGGTYDVEFDRETEGALIIQIQDKEGTVLKSMRMDPQFTMPVDPGTPIQLDAAPLMITAPYPWNARTIVFKTDEKLIDEFVIAAVLLRDALGQIPAQAFVTDKEVSLSDFQPLLDIFETCLQAGEDVRASRILEIYLLPLVEESLDDRFKKTNILKMDKTQITDLITETIARLDPSLTDDPLPAREGSIQLNHRYFPLATDLATIELGGGIRYVRYQKQIEFTRLNDPDCMNTSTNLPGYTCDTATPLTVYLLVSDRRTNTTEEITFTNDQKKIVVLGVELQPSHIIPSQAPPYIDLFVRMTE